MVRYADDFVVLCRDREEARRALARIQQWVEQAGLTLHPEKTRIVDASQRGGFDFLGYHFERGKKWPRKKSCRSCEKPMRKLTPRNSGRADAQQSSASINPRAARLVRLLQARLSKSRCATLDRWVRGRLRSILRKRRAERSGYVRPTITNIWPNAYFASMGLFSLKAGPRRHIQSQR